MAAAGSVPQPPHCEQGLSVLGHLLRLLPEAPADPQLPAPSEQGPEEQLGRSLHVGRVRDCDPMKHCLPRLPRTFLSTLGLPGSPSASCGGQCSIRTS